MDSDGEEIGRGRRADPSSSRESSPQPRQQRSFSPPASDDGDIVIPPVQNDDDDTPPPGAMPLIRGPVAFHGAVPAPPNTYQAQVPKASPFYFLPGQEVPAPPPAPPKPKTKQKSGRKKKADGPFSDQTSRFRVNPSGFEIHPPAPVITPDMQQGSGPYASSFRAVGNGAGLHGPPTYPANGPVTQLAGPGMWSADATQPVAGPSNVAQQPIPTATPARARGTKAKTPSTRSTQKKRAEKNKQPPPQQQQQQLQLQTQPSAPTHVPPLNSNVQAMDGSYYRHDYDKQPLTPTGVAGTSMQGTSAQPPVSANTVPGPPPNSSQVPGTTALTLQGQTHPTGLPPAGPARPLRMLTLLITDMRSGVADHQLAEVRVALRQADNVQDGFWADSRDVVRELQASPSRVDGPAKVYTMRGKYRQFFLRLSTENIEECASANLSVSIERTLDVVIEPNPPPGSAPLPPNIPPDLLPPPHDRDSDTESVHRSPYGTPQPRSGYPRDHSRKRRMSVTSISSTDSRHPSTRPSSRHTHRTHFHSTHDGGSSYGGLPPKKSKRHSHGHARAPSAAVSTSSKMSEIREYLQKQKSTAPLPETHPNIGSPGYERSPSAASLASTPEEIEEAILKYVRPQVEEDRAWMKYMESRARPRRIIEVLKQFSFVHGKMEVLAGQLTPDEWEGAPGQEIRKDHILKVLDLSPQWAAECEEMLALMDMYGEKGTRYEDARVVQMIISDPPVPVGKPAKRCLRLLREIDVEWRSKHMEFPPEDDDIVNRDGRTEPNSQNMEARV